MQILTVEQHAQMLIHCSPITPLAEDLVHFLAQQRGLPSKQQLLADNTENLSKRDAVRFWQYTEAVNPYVRLRNEYVPIPAQSIIQLY